MVESLDGESAQVFLMGHKRLRKGQVAGEEPLRVAVEHLGDAPFDSGSAVIKASAMELVSSMKELMRMNPLYKEQIVLFVQVGRRVSHGVYSWGMSN